MFSFTEIIFIAILALVFIGPKQLPEVARNIARFLNEIRRASRSIFSELHDQNHSIHQVQNSLNQKNENQSQHSSSVNKETTSLKSENSETVHFDKKEGNQ